MTTSIDRNAEFAQTKLAQIQGERDKEQAIRDRVANGELRDNGNGTFTVLTGWDAGETIRATLNAEGRIEQILAEHGVTEVNGKLAIYSRRPTWYGQGQIVPEGMDDIEQIIDLIGGPLEYSKQPVFYRDLMTGEFKPVEEVFAAVWMDQDGRNDALRGKTVGSTYKHAQDVEAARWTQDLVGERCVYESVVRLRGKSKFAVGIRLVDDMVIDPEGIADAVAKYLYVVNTHDGSGKLTTMVTPWRIECANTERFGLRDASATWGVRHTTNWNSEARQQEARRTLGLVDKYFERFKRDEEALAQSEITMKQFWELVRDIYPAPEEETKRSTSLDDRRIETISGLFSANTRRLGRTAYAAERTLTEFLDWKKDVRPGRSFKGDLMAARTTLAMEGAEDDTKTRVHKQLLTLARG